MATAAVSVDVRTVLSPSPRVALRSASLLDPAVVTAFQETFELVRRERSELRLVLTGPWPPYSFVGATGAARIGALAELLARSTTTRPE